jgi:hypothetical protein
MRKSEVPRKQIFSVTCPICGVCTGKRCLLLSGAPRSEAHIERKWAAIEATIESKRIHLVVDVCPVSALPGASDLLVALPIHSMLRCNLGTSSKFTRGARCARMLGMKDPSLRSALVVVGIATG